MNLKEKQNQLNERLLEASRAGDLKTTLECLAAGADVNCFDTIDGRYPLLHAAEVGAVEVSQALLATGRIKYDDKCLENWTVPKLARKFEEVVKGYENKKRYRTIETLFRQAERGELPEMPTWPGVPEVPAEYRRAAKPAPPQPPFRGPKR